MRILFLSHYAVPHIGGIEVVVDALSRELGSRGHEVRQIAAGAGGPGEVAAGGAEVIRVPALNSAERRMGIPYPVFSPTLVGALRRELEVADVIHAHGYLYMPCALGLRMARRRSGGPARVLTEHVGHVPYESRVLDGVESGAVAAIGRGTVRAAEAVIVLNERVEAEVRALGPRGPVRTIHNGVDLGHYRPPEGDERAQLRGELGWDERPRVLFAGRLVPKKGLGLALEAAASAAGAFQLVVAGAGSPPADVGDALVLGEVEPERLARLYRAADALLLPSVGEGFPLTAQEAMASGLPVFLRDQPEHRPYLDGAGPGARLLPPDAAEIARKVAALVSDPEVLERARRAARVHAERTFSWSGAAGHHERLYEQLLG